ncbi:hypothetical protein NSQ59_09690 [Margalitia sp. FSL K6-0131]|uniref:hypothetical protein n=1 Tax=Margalitia sp. FSL K6-0131 TaxID=2954604 RepID=UPI000F89D0EE
MKKAWLIAAVYCLLILTILTIIANEGPSKKGIFDLIADIGGTKGSTNHLMIYTVAIPVIVTFFNQVTEKFESPLYVTTFGSRFRTWHAHVICAFLLSFILTCLIMLISFLIGGTLVGMNNTWLNYSGSIAQLLHNKETFQSIVPNVSVEHIIISLLVTKFLGFLMICFSVLFLKQLTNNSAIIMIILIGLAALDQTGVFRTPFYTLTTTLSIRNWLDPMITIYHCIYLFVITLLLYGTAGMLYERKDFLS